MPNTFSVHMHSRLSDISISTLHVYKRSLPNAVSHLYLPTSLPTTMSVVEEQNTLRQRLGFATPSQDTVAKPGMSNDSYIDSIPNTAASYTPTHKGYVHKLLSIPDTLLSSLSTISFPPAIAASRMAIISMMSASITWGQLRILTADQGVFTFPVQKKGSEQMVVRPEDRADIRVIRNTFWFRLVVLADLGFAEAYMAGDCEVSDLVQVFKASHSEIVMNEATR